jgi:hypothetical protein
MLHPSSSFETKQPDQATPSCLDRDRNARGWSQVRARRNPDDVAYPDSFQIRADGRCGKHCRRQSHALHMSPTLAVLTADPAKSSPAPPSVPRASPPTNTKPRQRSKMSPREPTQETSVPLAPCLSRPLATVICFSRALSATATCTNRHPTYPKHVSCQTFRWTNASLPLLNAVALVNRFKSTTMRAILCLSNAFHCRWRPQAR